MGQRSSSQNSTSSPLSAFLWPSLGMFSSHSPSISRNSLTRIWPPRMPEHQNHSRKGLIPRGCLTHRWRESESFRTKTAKTILRGESWTQSVVLSWAPLSPKWSPFFLGFRPMAQQAESPRRNVGHCSVVSSLRSCHIPHANRPPDRPPPGGKHPHVHHRCRAQAATTRPPRASCQMGTKVTTSSLNFGGRLIHLPPVVRILTGSRWAGFLLMNVGELGNFISYAFAPASVVAPLGTVSGIGVGPIVSRSNSCLVCFDRQLFLCPTPTERTLSEGRHAQIPNPVKFLTGISGRVPGDLHLHLGCCHRRVFGQYLRYTLRS